MAENNPFKGIGSGENLTCEVCGCDVFDGSYICMDCAKKIVANDRVICPICGRKLVEPAPACLECKSRAPVYEFARSAFCYEEGIVYLIKRFKTLKPYLADVFTDFMAPLAERYFLEFDVICWIPMFESDEKRRGYNQSRLLAEQISKRCGIPFSPLLKKRVNTLPQKDLTVEERRKNLIGAFHAVEKVTGKSVLIVDDVMTTGATLDSAATALKKAGAARVGGLTFASVRYKRDRI